MPTYLYKREDGSTFEIDQRITAPILKNCPTTGQDVKRLISKGAGLIFKGSGFYLTDYARAPDGSPKARESGSKNNNSSDQTTADAAGKTESDSATESKKSAANGSESSGKSSSKSKNVSKSSQSNPSPPTDAGS